MHKKIYKKVEQKCFFDSSHIWILTKTFETILKIFEDIGFQEKSMIKKEDMCSDQD